MLDYTRAIINKTVKDVETAFTVFHFGTQILYIAYLAYLIFTKNKIWYLHLALLLISAAFLAYDIIATKNITELKKEKISIFKKRKHKARISQAKQQKARIQKIKFYLSHSIKLFVLASAFYPIIVMPDTVHPLSIMCTTVMVLLWILLVVFEVLKIMLEGRVDLFTEALQADVEFVTKPLSLVKDTFKKIMRKEVEEKPEPTQDRLYLDKLVASARDEKSAKKAEAKATKSEKLSSWLDGHLSKLTAKRAANEQPAEVPETQELAVATETAVTEVTEEV